MKSFLLVLFLVSVAMSATYTDNFNRTNEHPLAGNWTTVDSSLMDSSNQIWYTGAADYWDNKICSAYWNANTLTNDQYSQVTYVQKGDEYGFGACCRMSTSAKTYYWAGKFNSQELRIWKSVAGTQTQLAAKDLTGTWNEGDTIRCECIGTTIRAIRRNGAAKDTASATDAAIASGRAGIWSSRGVFDNWSAGDLGATCTAPTITGIVWACTTGRYTAKLQTTGGGSHDSLHAITTLPAGLSIVGDSIKGTPTTAAAKAGYWVRIYGCANDSTPDSITIIRGLALDSVRPATVWAGDTIKIYGSLFGASQGSSTLAMGDSTPTVYSWAAGLIKIKCPAFPDTGHYGFKVTDGVQTDSTSDTAVYYETAPIISAQPADTTVCIGGTGTFRLTATGIGALAYQWSRYTSGAWANVGTSASSYSYTAAAGNNGDSIKCAVTDNNGTTTSSKAILTVTQLPAFTYNTNPATYSVGTAISTNSVSSSGGTIASFSGSVPAGLSLNTSTGAVTGTPTTVSGSTVYPITGTNCSGSSVTNLTITVNSAKPGGLAYTGTPFHDSTGSAASHALTNTGGAGTVKVRTALPKGYSISASTGLITKTATADSIHAATNYVVVDSNVTGKDSVTISITVHQGRPIWSWVTNPLACKVGTAITRDSAISTNGTIDSFKVQGTALPASIAISKTTGAISGTASAAQAVTAYTVRGYNSAGYRDTTFSISGQAIGQRAARMQKIFSFSF